MEGWVTKPLGDIVVKTATIDPRKKPDESFFYVDVSSVSNKTLEITEETELMGKEAPSRARRVIRSGDVIFATVRPTLRRIAIVPEYLDGEVCSTGYFVFQTKPELYNRYLYYFLQTEAFMARVEKLQAGASYPAVNDTQIRAELISYPEVFEQKRIVAILDEIFADIEQVRAKTEQNLKNARELFESYLQQVFSQRGEEWIEKTLGDVCKFENGDRGKNYPSRSQFVESGFAFINAGHIDDGTVDFSKMNYITEENYDLLSRGKVKQGDILFCLRGSLGKFAVIEDDAQGAIASSLVIVRPHNDLSVSFLLHYLRSGLCKSMIEKYAGGAAQPNLGAKDLAKFSISVPPTAQQLHTSDKLDSLMVAVENLESMYSDKLAALDELKQSILQNAFSGELTKASDNKTKQGALA